MAGVLFPILAAVGLDSYGLQMGTMGIAETDPEGATTTYLVGSYIGDAAPLFWGIGTIFVALALLKRDSSLAGKALAAGLAIPAILFLLATADFIDIDALFLVGWLMMSFFTICTGLDTLMGKEASADTPYPAQGLQHLRLLQSSATSPCESECNHTYTAGWCHDTPSLKNSSVREYRLNNWLT